MRSESEQDGGRERILIVDDEEGIRTVLSIILEQAGYRTVTAASGEEALALLAQSPVDLVITDLALGSGMDGLQLLREVRKRYDVPMVMITAFGTLRAVAEAMRAGAYDFIRKPLKMDDILAVVRGALRHYALSTKGAAALPEETVRHAAGLLVGESPAMQEVYRLIENVARLDIPVLIQGETGTGKSTVALAIHRSGRTAPGPFVELDCARTPEERQEDELFGRGDAQGLVVQAGGGTLMLDNVDEMSARLQARLPAFLRTIYVRSRSGVLGEHEVQRVLAGSRVPLYRLVEAGRFSESLYNVLSTVVVDLPPLRRRPEDIPLLTARFLAEASKDGKPVRLQAAALECICRYSWPGNVRELKEALDEAVRKAADSVVRVSDLPLHVRAAVGGTGTGEGVPQEPGMPGALARRFIEENERRFSRVLRNRRTAASDRGNEQG